MPSIKFCPNCKSEDVEMVAGGITGGWMCRACGYSGPVLEKEILDKKIGGKDEPKEN